MSRSPSGPPRALAVLLAAALAAASLPAVPGLADDGADTEPPGPVPNLRLETERHDGLYANELPVWSWDAASDDGEIARYEVRQTDPDQDTRISDVPSEDRRYDAEDPGDGRICIEVHAVDEAGNTGPWTDRNCVHLDRIPPEHAFGQPQPATLHLEGPEVLDVQLMPGVPSERAYVLGGIHVYLNSTDPGEYRSNLDRAVMEEAPACSEPFLCGTGPVHPCENDLGPPHVCVFADDEHDTIDPYVRALTGRTTDNANNTVREATVTYTKVDVAAVERVDQDGTRGAVHWEATSADSFVRYAVYATLTGPDGPTLPARLVATVDDRTTTQAVDTVPTAGETWTYQVATITSAPATGIAYTTHATELAYASEDGRVSQPVGCSPISYCPE